MLPRPVIGLLDAVLLSGCGQRGPAAEDVPDAETGATLTMLTQTLRRFSAENQRVPVSLSELVSSKYLPSLPPAPAGKKFAINPKRVEVILVGQ